MEIKEVRLGVDNRNPLSYGFASYEAIDEAHSIYTFGTSLYGLTAFWPARNFLAELRTKLGTQVAVAALSGTLLKHIKKVVKEWLQLDDN